MSESSKPRVVFFERWSHAIAEEHTAANPQIDWRRLRLDAPEAALWDELGAAHVYQIRSTRSELPSQFWAHGDLLARCPSLLAVSANGSGCDTVDIDACTRAGVLVVNQAGGNKEAVAEHAFGMMLCLTKRILEADHAVRSVPELARETLMGHDMYGRTLGIVGLGHVGTRVAAIARAAFAMEVIAFDPFITPAQFTERGARSVDFPTLLASADFVTVHCPRNSRSERMFDAAAFAAMKPSAYFVNTARGGIHDEAALAAALRAGQIAGAGLDVWDHEPPALDHPLLHLERVVVSPHTAGVTHEARTNMATGTVAQIVDLLAAKRPPRILNPDAWDRYADRHAQILGVRPAD
ncbi:MAG: 3-phosphoglycerate dehydrogenase [Ectothiorhodospiraceae bacterium]|nr:3-phosphoglycerate dehydrogenase [Ectothiorhodospiraceae bacterium]